MSAVGGLTDETALTPDVSCGSTPVIACCVAAYFVGLRRCCTARVSCRPKADACMSRSSSTNRSLDAERDKTDPRGLLRWLNFSDRRQPVVGGRRLRAMCYNQSGRLDFLSGRFDSVPHPFLRLCWACPSRVNFPTNPSSVLPNLNEMTESRHRRPTVEQGHGASSSMTRSLLAQIG